MSKLKPAALFLCASLALSVQVANAADEAMTDSACDIDEMMSSNHKKMNELAVGIYKANLEEPLAKQIETAPSVKDASCLPILDTLDTLLRMRIPSTGAIMSGIMAKIRDMACKYANDFIGGVVGKMQFNVSDPYGIASVGVGATTGEGGTQVDQYDFGAVVKDKVMEAAAAKAREVMNEQSRGVADKIPTVTPDRLPRVENSVGDVVKDAMNGL